MHLLLMYRLLSDYPGLGMVANCWFPFVAVLCLLRLCCALQVCRSRLQLQLAGQLPGLAELAYSRSSNTSSSSCLVHRASSPGSGEPRERLAALQLGRQPSSHVMAAAAGKLPDIATAR
jgi:hypothetical protein